MTKFQFEQERDFSNPCIVAPTKLNRLVDIGVSRLEKLEGTVLLEVTTITKTGKKSVFDTLEAALNQDNSLKNPIRSIWITGRIEGVAVFLAEYGVGSTRIKEYGCSLYVAGRDASWVNETFAELEEQVERVIIKDVYSLLGKITRDSILTLVVTLVVSMFTIGIVTISSIRSIGPKEYLQKEQVVKLNDMFDGADTAEKKSEALFQERRAILSHAADSLSKTDPVARFLMSKRGFFLILPLFAAIGCLIYVATKCSPTLVFLWGDWEEHFAKITKKRSLIMFGGISSFTIGALSSLFASSIG